MCYSERVTTNPTRPPLGVVAAVYVIARCDAPPRNETVDWCGIDVDPIKELAVPKMLSYMVPAATVSVPGFVE